MQATSIAMGQAKPQVSLTVPNHNHFAQVLDIFLDAIAKTKKLIF